LRFFVHRIPFFYCRQLWAHFFGSDSPPRFSGQPFTITKRHPSLFSPFFFGLILSVSSKPVFFFFFSLVASFFYSSPFFFFFCSFLFLFFGLAPCTSVDSFGSAAEVLASFSPCFCVTPCFKLATFCHLFHFFFCARLTGKSNGSFSFFLACSTFGALFSVCLLLFFSAEVSFYRLGIF